VCSNTVDEQPDVLLNMWAKKKPAVAGFLKGLHQKRAALSIE